MAQNDRERLEEHRTATEEYLDALDKLAGHETHILAGPRCENCGTVLEQYRAASVAHARSAIHLGI